MKYVTGKFLKQKKAQEYSVCRTSNNDKLVLIQSDKAIGRFDPETRKGIYNPNGSTFAHLTKFLGAVDMEFPQEFVDQCLAAEVKPGDDISGGAGIVFFQKLPDKPVPPKPRYPDLNDLYRELHRTGNTPNKLTDNVAQDFISVENFMTMLEVKVFKMVTPIHHAIVTDFRNPDWDTLNAWKAEFIVKSQVLRGFINAASLMGSPSELIEPMLKHLHNALWAACEALGEASPTGQMAELWQQEFERG